MYIYNNYEFHEAVLIKIKVIKMIQLTIRISFRVKNKKTTLHDCNRCSQSFIFSLEV